MAQSITASSPGAPAGDPPDDGMVWVPGGEFTMGSDRHYVEERPAHRVVVDGFWMDRHTVTNAEFARFVAETGHVTVAERPADPVDYPGADPAKLVPSSAVFTPPSHRVDLRDAYQWWSYVPGADWRHPRGPESTVDLLDDHPVVHVALADVVAYAEWAGKVLPTEAEWERAARGGLDGAEYAWGDELTPGGVHLANTWQGDFPLANLRTDGHEWTAPVDAFPANGYGLWQMIGNVWEWTDDWYAPHRELASAAPSCCGTPAPRANPTGGTAESSVDVGAPAVTIPRKVSKGGSFLCASNYCRRYRPAARMPQAIDTSTCHLGFRLIVHP